MYRLYVTKCLEEKTESENIAKEWLYRQVFNEEFNLSFYKPSVDTCDSFVKRLKESKSEIEIAQLKEGQTQHHEEAEKRYTRKKTG